MVGVRESESHIVRAGGEIVRDRESYCQEMRESEFYIVSAGGEGVRESYCQCWG